MGPALRSALEESGISTPVLGSKKRPRPRTENVPNKKKRLSQPESEDIDWKHRFETLQRDFAGLKETFKVWFRDQLLNFENLKPKIKKKVESLMLDKQSLQDQMLALERYHQAEMEKFQREHSAKQILFAALSDRNREISERLDLVTAENEELTKSKYKAENDLRQVDEALERVTKHMNEVEKENAKKNKDLSSLENKLRDLESLQQQGSIFEDSLKEYKQQVQCLLEENQKLESANLYLTEQADTQLKHFEAEKKNFVRVIREYEEALRQKDGKSKQKKTTEENAEEEEDNETSSNPKLSYKRLAKALEESRTREAFLKEKLRDAVEEHRQALEDNHSFTRIISKQETTIESLEAALKNTESSMGLFSPIFSHNGQRAEEDLITDSFTLRCPKDKNISKTSPYLADI